VFRTKQSRAVHDFNINIRTMREGVSVQEEKERSMRERIHKRYNGGTRKKDVSLKIVPRGILSNGVRIMFLDYSYGKITEGKCIALELDRAAKRMYFIGTDEDDAFTLVSVNRSSKLVQFSADDTKDWEPFEGYYDLYRDKESGDYYIDFTKVERRNT